MHHQTKPLLLALHRPELCHGVRCTRRTHHLQTWRGRCLASYSLHLPSRDVSHSLVHGHVRRRRKQQATT